MTLSAILGNALSGMQASQTRLAATANNIANQDTPSYRRSETQLTAEPGGGVSAAVVTVGDAGEPDALADMTGLIESGESFAANARAFETGADLWAVLLAIKRD